MHHGRRIADIHLKRIDGIWRVEAGQILTGTGGDYKKFARTWNGMKRTIETARKRIGQKGVDPESLDKELGMEMMKVLMGG